MVSRITGFMILLFGLVPLVSLLVSLIYGDGLWPDFAGFGLIYILSGLLMARPWRKMENRLTSSDGFLIVGMIWITISILGALPLMEVLDLEFPDALFESASAFTTTGATVLTGLDDMQPSILIYRQLLQWLGGIGFIVSAIAIMPLLGIGGMRMMNAEVPGPIKNEKLAPRVAGTAKIIFYMYLVLTVCCAFFYWLAGMPLFDAVAHSLTTLSTGGFSTHDASIGYFHNRSIEGVAVIFMLIAAINFNVHYRIFINGRLLEYWRDSEVKSFIVVACVLVILVALELYLNRTHSSFWNSLSVSLFTVISVITSTGYGVEDFSLWPAGLPVMLIFLSFMGGCSESTAGGMKTFRYVVLIKQGYIEMLRLMHPRLVRPVKINGKVLETAVIDSIWGFFSVYIAVFVIFLLLMMASGMDQVTAFGAVATCLNNLGPGLGKVATSFTTTTPFQEYTLAAAMIMGRLELFTLLILLTPDYWKH